MQTGTLSLYFRSAFKGLVYFLGSFYLPLPLLTNQDLLASTNEDGFWVNYKERI